MKNSTRELAAAGLRLVKNRALDPTRADDAIGIVTVIYQIEKSRRASRAIGVDVANQVGSGGQLEALDECAAFANRRGIIQNADFWELSVNLVDDADGVVTAAVGDDEKLKIAFVVPSKELGVIPQNGLYPALLIVRRNQ